MNRVRYLSLLLAVVAGCASPMAQLRDDNRRLTQTVSELRAARRVQDRKLRDLQHQLDEARSSGGLPSLPVEVIAPSGGAVRTSAPAPATAMAAPPPANGNERVVGVTEDGTEIVYEGEAALGRAAPSISISALSSDNGGDDLAASAPTPSRRRAPLPVSVPASADVPTASDRIEVTRHVPVISARAAMRTKTRDATRDVPGDRGGDASNDYRAAVELVKAGKHDDAVAALRAFIAKYPRHDYADNAQYWLGEAFYAQKDYPHALTEFRAVIEVYPRGNKVPDALLKVGYCYQAMGQGEKAHAVLQQVVTRYPKSEPATLAAKRLETP